MRMETGYARIIILIGLMTLLTNKGKKKTRQRNIRNYMTAAAYFIGKYLADR